MNTTIPAGFTLNELLAYLEQDEETPEGFATLSEWSEHLGVGPSRMRSLLKEAKMAGVLSLGKDRRERLDGVMSPVPVYKFELEMAQE